MAENQFSALDSLPNEVKELVLYELSIVELLCISCKTGLGKQMFRKNYN